MKHLIIYAHPNPDSFNHHILEATVNKLKELGESVEIRDLYQLKFNPCFDLNDIRAIEAGQVLPDVKNEQDFIRHSDKITIIAPIWWGYIPAILKGYFDRVFTQDFAFAQMSSGWKGLLNEKKFGMINTLGMSKEEVIETGGDPGFKQMIDRYLFDYVDSPLCFHQIFYGVDSAGHEKRIEMLDETAKIIEQFVLDPNYCPFFG
ncbi:MAG: NAD(P)H-dependent oxidoreductase [Bacteroidales bacterium]